MSSDDPLDPGPSAGVDPEALLAPDIPQPSPAGAAVKDAASPSEESEGEFESRIREASLQHDSKAAAENLAAAQSKGLLLRLKNLPGDDRDL